MKASFQLDRSSVARQKDRMLKRSHWIASVIGETKRFAQTLCSSTDVELIEHTNRLRQFACYSAPQNDRRMLVMAAAAVMEAVRRKLGFDLFDTQLHAGIVVSMGAIAEMQTGEGKTLALALPAYVHALAGRGVHVATPNYYLATRDCHQLTPAFELLGMSVGLLKDGGDPSQTRSAYQADITYGPGFAFGFDYLRDQLTLDQVAAGRLGDRLYQQLCGVGVADQLLQRGLHAAIVDEADQVLIDDAVSPLLLSGPSSHEEAPDAKHHRAANRLAQQLVAEVDYELVGDQGVMLTDTGFEKIYCDQAMAIDEDLRRPWHEYVILALRAQHQYRRDVHYIQQENAVRIVDASTGRIMPDRTWSAGLHQAIEAVEGLPITCAPAPLAKITRQRFFRNYASLAGMTGTASGCEQELAAVYGLPVAVVPLRLASRRTILPDYICLTQSEKLAAIAAECAWMIQQGRAVLVGTLSIAESVAVAKALDQQGLNYSMLNGVQDADEAGVIARAGQSGVITVATNLAGRGTDIVLAESVAKCGGLHVIVTQQHPLSRVDRQLIGRCARCGDLGSARIYLSAEDPIAQRQAPWIGRAICRWDHRGRRDTIKLRPRIRKVQSAQQRVVAAERWRLLQSDRQDEELLTSGSPQPKHCYSLER